jgi:putative peptide zinc metalloprotease protein
MIDSNITQIEVQEFATSDIDRQYIAGYEGRHFEISESIALPIAVLLLCIIALDGYFIATATMLVHFGDVSVYVIPGVLGLLLLSSFIHELEHASACRHFKVKYGGVGFGLYLTFPVFYTDVSETWKLKRKERLVVNMAGVYFQLIMLIPFFLLYFVTDNSISKWFLLTVNIGLLVTLNLFFKFDGYWIVSDLLVRMFKPVLGKFTNRKKPVHAESE